MQRGQAVCVSSMPNLSKLSLCPPRVPAAVGTLMWHATKARIVTSYRAAMKRAIEREKAGPAGEPEKPDEAVVVVSVEDTDVHREEDPSDEEGEPANAPAPAQVQQASGGKRRRASPEGSSLNDDSDQMDVTSELAAHDLWMKLCSVPSAPAHSNDTVKEAWEVGRDIADALSWMKKIKYDFGVNEGTSYEHLINNNGYKKTITWVNSVDNSELQPPAFSTTPRPSSDPYMRDSKIAALQQTALLGGGCFYTGQQARLGVVEYESQPAEQVATLETDHVVPRIWFSALLSVKEFMYAAEDPCNCVPVQKQVNRSKQDKALSFSRTQDEQYYAPRWSHGSRNTRDDRKRAAARVVAYVLLTYPLVCASRTVLLDMLGVNVTPFAHQIDNIIELVVDPPAQHQVRMAYVAYLRHGWCNPLIVSEGARKAVADPKHALHKLLRRRARGADHGSRALIRSFHESGVTFQQ